MRSRVPSLSAPTGAAAPRIPPRAWAVPDSGDMLLSALLWMLLGFPTVVALVMSPWFLVAITVCDTRPACHVGTSLGGWVIVVGGMVGFVAGAVLSVRAAARGRRLFPGAIVGTVLVLVAWLVGSLLLG